MLNGQLEYAKFNKDSILAASDEDVPKLKLTASEEELELRKEVELEDKKAQATKSNKKTQK